MTAVVKSLHVVHPNEEAADFDWKNLYAFAGVAALLAAQAPAPQAPRHPIPD